MCDANGVPFLSAGSLMCVTRTVLLTPSASVSISEDNWCDAVFILPCTAPAKHHVVA